MTEESVFVYLLVEKPNYLLDVLLQLRENTGLHDGKYGLPGGKRERKEPLVVTAVREINEELGLTVDPKHLLRLRRCKGTGENGVKWLCHFYLILLDELSRNKLQLNEPDKHKEIQWYPINHLPDNIVPVVYEVIKQIPERSIRIARTLKHKDSI